jgi:UDP-glucuronate decarboxylase
MNQKRILVTGGAGFIGSHLCKKLIEMGHYVICLDNNFTGSIKNINELIIESNNGKSNFEFIRHDITQPILLEVDEIYHLACPASPKAYQYNSIKTIKTNILGTLNSLGIAKRTKAKILLTSTSEIYGDPLISPQNEEYWGNVNPIGIRSCYDEGKRVAETLMIEYKRNHNVILLIKYWIIKTLLFMEMVHKPEVFVM